VCAGHPCVCRTPLCVQDAPVCAGRPCVCMQDAPVCACRTPCVCMQDAPVCAGHLCVCRTPLCVQDTPVCAGRHCVCRTPLCVQDATVCACRMPVRVHHCGPCVDNTFAAVHVIQYNTKIVQYSRGCETPTNTDVIWKIMDAILVP
jgi:hypothetical protein